MINEIKINFHKNCRIYSRYRKNLSFCAVVMTALTAITSFDIAANAANRERPNNNHMDNSRSIFMSNYHLINRTMDYNNIRKYYPQITASIANEIKDDMQAMNSNLWSSRMLIMSTDTIFYLINIVLDSNGNVKSYATSFRSAWGNF